MLSVDRKDPVSLQAFTEGSREIFYQLQKVKILDFDRITFVHLISYKDFYLGPFLNNGLGVLRIHFTTLISD